MTEVAALEVYAGQLSEAAQKSTTAAGKHHEFINGDALTDVDTESGPVPTLAKQARLYSEAIPDAVTELSAQMTDGKIHPDEASGRAAVADGQYFYVKSTNPLISRSLFQRINAATSSHIVDDPSAVTVAELSKLVQSQLGLAVASEEVAVSLADEEGGEQLLLTSLRLRTSVFEARTDDAASGIYGSDQGALLHADDHGMSLGPLMFGTTLLPGLYVVDEEDAILQELSDPGPAPETLAPQLTDALAGGVYFAPKLVTVPGVPLRVDVSSMIAPREDDAGVVASIFSYTTAESITSTRELVVQAARFGPTARLKLRERDNALTHHVMELSMTELPPGPFPATAPNVLVIGDSICNRQGAYYLNAALLAAGYSANFMGTFQGSQDPDNPNNMEGVLGECREGFSTGNYTYADMAEFNIPLPAGQEAAYLSMSKVQRRNSNPFIRPAVESDDPAIIRNGYVLDFAFYQQRFSLPSPDVIVYALGMNEFIRVTNANELNAYVLDNENLMFKRIRAAWPNVKILRCLPGLPFQRTRNPQWGDRYVPMIRAVMTNLQTMGNARNILVPSWTFANPETGYATGNDVVDPLTGITKVEVTDNTHPIGSNRIRLFQGIAPYIAAAHLNLI